MLNFAFLSRSYKYLLVFFILTFSSCINCYVVEKRPNEVFKFMTPVIGGIKQAVMIRGSNINNPVLIYLHGGPGFPLFPFEPMGKTMKQLEKDFTMVYWEQRGTGKSFSRRIKPGSMNTRQFVEDTRQLVEFIRELTGQQKVLIWAHSWGTNIGVLFASRYPEMVHAYISTGQSVNPLQNERLNYEFVLEKATVDNNRRALKQLAEIDTVSENYSLSDALVLRKWVYRYGGVVKSNKNKRPYFDLAEAHQTLNSPFYNLSDRINMLMFPFFSAEELWDDLKQINLSREVTRLEVPVYFLIGSHDIIVSAQLAHSYFKMLDAPKGKTLIWFEKSAHRPHNEEREKFLEVFRRKIIPEVFNKNLVTNIDEENAEDQID